jgi:hypothetical protein
LWATTPGWGIPADILGTPNVRTVVKIIIPPGLQFTYRFFGQFTAGVFRSDQASTLFVALDDTPIQNLLFQRDVHQIRDFYIAGIRFELRRVRPEFHLYVYNISKYNCRMILLIFGIRSSESCGSSNIDFVHFI